MFTSSTPKIIYFYKNLIKDEKFVSAHIAFFCATCANVPSGTNIENIEKTSIYGTFGTEMPHGTLAQVALTSYMKGEFLYQLFIIMSINLQGGLTAVPLKIGKSAQGYTQGFEYSMQWLLHHLTDKGMDKNSSGISISSG